MSRWHQHRRYAQNHPETRQKFALAIREHGADAFVVSLLEECPANKLNERENYWINRLDTWANGYNTMKKGVSNRKGKVNSAESNRKRSETLRARKAAGKAVGCPKGTRPWNKKYETHEEMLAARRARLNPEGRKKQRCPRTGRYIKRV